MVLVPSNYYAKWPIFHLKQLPVYGDAILCSVIVWAAVYFTVAYYSNSNSHYRKLDQYNQFGWRKRVLSSAFTAIIIYLCAGSLNRSPNVFESDPELEYIFSIACGYFLIDGLIALVNFRFAGFLDVFHHFACFGVYFLSFMPFAQREGVRFLFFETSTIFLNMSWFAEKTGFKDTFLHKFSGFMFAGVFLVVRVFYGTYAMIDVGVEFYRNNAFKLAPVASTIIMMSAIALGSLNFYWWSLIFKKILLLKKKKE